MGQVLIRNLDDALLADYRRVAKDGGRSLEAELRDALARARPVVERKLSRDELVQMSRDIRALNANLVSDVTGLQLIREDRDGYRDA